MTFSICHLLKNDYTGFRAAGDLSITVFQHKVNASGNHRREKVVQMKLTNIQSAFAAGLFKTKYTHNMKSKKQQYHFPGGYSLLQTAIVSSDYLKHPIRFITKSLEKFSGSAYSSSLGPNRKIIVTQDPGFISYVLREHHTNYQKSPFSDHVAQYFGNGLLYSKGEYWLKQRRLIQPAFHKDKIHGLYDIMIKRINDFISTFPVGEKVDLYPLVHQLSFSVLIKSLFDINLSSNIIAELSELFTQLQDFLMTDINQPWRKIFYPFTGTKKTNFKKAKRLRAIIQEIITQRKASTENFSDLLDMLLNSKYEDTGEAMTDEQLIDEVLILIIAGHETTANSLAWLLHLIASNSEIQQKLASTFHNSTINDSLNNEYLKATINEGMRLYPTAWITDRVAIEDDQFGEYSFPKNTIIIPFFYGVHRDEKLWEDALKFKPDRFMADGKLIKSKNYFPFGAGPRMCIGNNFAMAEMSFFVQAFLNKFHIESTGQIPEMKPLITLRPDKVILKVAKINP